MGGPNVAMVRGFYDEGFREFLAKVVDQPVEFRREVREYLDAGDRVVVLLRLFGRPRGGEAESEVPEIHVWTVRDGKILALEAIFDTAAALRAWQLAVSLSGGSKTPGGRPQSHRPASDSRRLDVVEVWAGVF